MTTDAITYWERCATKLWGRHIWDVERKVIFGAAQMTSAPGRVLELGCDGGHWSRLLADRGWKITCTDISEQALRLCKDRLPEAECILVSPLDRRLPCQSGTIRLMLCIEVWQVVHEPWVLSEAGRVLEPGGVLVITCPNRSSWRGVCSTLNGTASTWYAGSYVAWRRKARDNGLMIVKEEGYA